MKGYIYKIFDNTNGNVYYGSTVQKLSMRMSGLRSEHKKGKIISCSIILKNDDYSYSLVEEVECDSKLVLQQRERYYIENNDCVNKIMPTKLKQVYYVDSKGEHKTSINVESEVKALERQLVETECKEYFGGKIVCCCGGITTDENLRKHRKSLKHLNNLKKLLCST